MLVSLVVRKILNKAMFNISGVVEKEIVHMESQKENKTCSTVSSVHIKRHFHTYLASDAVAFVAFVLVGIAALAPGATTIYCCC